MLHQLLGHVLLIVSLIGSCSVIFSLFWNHFHLTRSWLGSGVDRICSGYILVMEQFLPVPNCVCATQPDICTYACPGSICDPVTLLTIRTPVASITANVLCVIRTSRPSSLPVPVIVMEFHAEDSLCWSPPALCLWNDWLYLSPSSPLWCVGSVAKTSIRVLLPRISLRACACIMNMKFAFNKAPEQ